MAGKTWSPRLWRGGAILPWDIRNWWGKWHITQIYLYVYSKSLGNVLWYHRNHSQATHCLPIIIQLPGKELGHFWKLHSVSCSSSASGISSQHAVHSWRRCRCRGRAICTFIWPKLLTHVRLRITDRLHHTRCCHFILSICSGFAYKSSRLLPKSVTSIPGSNVPDRTPQLCLGAELQGFP